MIYILRPRIKGVLTQEYIASNAFKKRVAYLHSGAKFALFGRLPRRYRLTDEFEHQFIFCRL